MKDRIMAFVEEKAEGWMDVDGLTKPGLDQIVGDLCELFAGEQKTIDLGADLAKACLKYDEAIQVYTAKGLAGFKEDGTAYLSADDLDDLYASWLEKAHEYLDRS